MEQLVEIAYELIAFRATFKGELFRHGMGIGKIKLLLDGRFGDLAECEVDVVP